ncbi:hypothetical protein INR49_009254, partial [Caranx melampygus]
KTDWDVGVARESIDRKRDITLSSQDGYWTIWLRNGNEYEALDGPPVPLSLRSGLEKVGVFVDYEEGLVSFYDVDAAALIYSFTGCCFTDKLHPYFSPCVNDGGKTDWDVGVARESIDRKGDITLSSQDGYWTIWLRNGNEYEALDGPPVPLSLRSGLEKVGVFVDYEEGLVSFYDVDAAALIYSFTGCCFTDKLHPYFSPCVND